MSPTILVTGSNGQLGSELKERAKLYPQFQFVFFGREEFPVNNETMVREIFQKYQPQYLINCAAYTAVDKAEEERDAAREINGLAVGFLAKTCSEYHTRFIHVSTDYVFNGTQKEPLKETDAVDPVNYYGATKLLGEQLALQYYPDSLIIRTSWVYSFYGKNFVKTMIRLMKEKESISVVNDQHGSPTYAADLAEAIMQIIQSGKWLPGIYNYSNEGVITWFDFASAIRELIRSDCKVNPIATDQFPTPAKRPAYSVLDKTKIKQAYSLPLKDWKQSLKTCIGRILP